MHLTCQSCNARFAIADERVRGRIVHLRCRSCGAMIEARLPRAEEERAAEPAPARREPPPLPAREWFAAIGDRQVGPLSTEEISLRIARGEISAEDLVWRRGLGYWEPVIAVEELCDALEAVPPSAETQPPPLPGRARGQLLHLVPPPAAEPCARGGAVPALALADPADEARQPPQLALIQPQPLPPARWPLWVALLGGLMMLGSSALLLMRRGSNGASLDAVGFAPPRAERVAPAEGLRIEPEHQPASRPAHELPALEVRRSRHHPPPAAAGEGLPDHRPDVPDEWREDSVADKLGTEPDDVKTTLALRIYRKNRATLEACDTLAERRGETLQKGSRAEFDVRVSAAGKVEIDVRGRGLSAALISCYRTVSAQWKVPGTGSEYSTSFEHVH